MKKIILITLVAVLLSGVLPTTAWAGVNTMTWFDPHFDWSSKDEAAFVNAAISKFEGTSQAYSVNQNPKAMGQIFFPNDLADSLGGRFNTADNGANVTNMNLGGDSRPQQEAMQFDDFAKG